MIDCSTEMTGYHNDDVVLGSTARTQMRDHRDTNRKRLRSGLTKAEKPLPKNFYSQGSYAMKTMVQHDDNKYDIDDGVYFDKDQLVGDRGGEMTALAVRQMVRDAIDDDSFTRAPEVRKHCVRVFYQAGYHVDLPIYRKIEENNFLGKTYYYELASASWKRSDAREVTDWFEKQNSSLSRQDDNDQMRRICRYLKKYAHSRPSWSSQVTTGFVITKLVTECLRAYPQRDDQAIVETMKAISNRLKFSVEVSHPVTPNEKISKGADDSKIVFFREKLDDAIGWLKPLDSSDCSKAKALDAWDKVFNTEYFSDRATSESDSARVQGASVFSAAAGILGGLSVAAAKAAPVHKEGSNRYA